MIKHILTGQRLVGHRSPFCDRLFVLLTALVVVAGTLGPVATAASPNVKKGKALTRTAESSQPDINADLEGLPLYFVANDGQADSRVDYYVQGSETNIYFTSKGITYQLSDEERRKRWAVKLNFEGANNVTPVGRSQTEASINYFKGSEQDWSNSKTYSRLIYKNLWDGIDLVYSGTSNELKYSFVVHPGADPADIKLTYEGADSVELNRKGDIRVTTPVTSFTDSRPYSFQRADSQRSPVTSSYDLAPGNGSTRSYGFNVGPFDPNKTLVIDPAVLVYAGYIGGDGGEEGLSIAVDSTGAAYITGSTTSAEATFPETVGPDLVLGTGAGPDQDAFVAKVAPSGSALVYAGYIGGEFSDTGQGIAVDSSGAAYVTGYTASSQTTFPDTGALDSSHNGDFDAFVAKVVPDGSTLAYAGYIGGSGGDLGSGIAVDSSGAAYVTGYTSSTQTTFPETVGPNLLHNGSFDAFVAKVTPSGSGLTYAGYIGGSDVEITAGIAIDSSGAAYITGYTRSTETTFPETGGPALTHSGGSLNGQDAFVAKVSPTGSALVYAGFIGGSGDEEAHGITVDSSGAAYVTGSTTSTHATFPETGGPDLTYNNAHDAFVAKVAIDGSALDYAGYIGGAATDIGFGIAVDSTGAAYVVGMTSSTEGTFPETGGPDLARNGDTDAFVAKVAADGSTIVFAGFIGGSGSNTGRGIAVGPPGVAYVAGWTTATEDTFPVSGGPDLTYNGNGDAFVAKVLETNTLTIAKAGTGNGTVTATGINCGTNELDCTEDYPYGDEIALTPNAGDNSTFTGWSGACSGTGECTVTMDQARSVTATFTLVNRTLTAVKAGTGNGTVSAAGIVCGTGGNDCSQDYPHGAEVELTAFVGDNSTFAGWSGDCSGTGACTVTMDQARSVTATFALNRTLTVHETGSGAGSISGTGINCGNGEVDCVEVYPHGTPVGLIATPDSESVFTGWSGDCSGTTACNVTMDADRDVSANFLPAGPHGVAVKIGSIKDQRVGGKLKLKIVGGLRPDDDVDACVANVGVIVQHKEGNKWVVWKKTTTNAAGRYNAVGVHALGSYRATYKGKTVEHAPEVTTSCTKDKSNARKHSH